MPIYDLRCDICEHEAPNTFASMSGRNSVPCPNGCGSMRVASWPGSAVNGPTMTKPLDLTKQLGRVFTSNAEVAAYERETSCRLVPNSDSSWKKTKIAATERAEKAAVKGGYRDLHHQRTEARSRLQRGS